MVTSLRFTTLLSLMAHVSYLNIEFGLGVWAGADIYKVYSCPSCGLTLDDGVKVFILPDDITIGLVYVF